MGKSQVQDISERLGAEFQRIVPLQPEKVRGGKRPSSTDIQSASEESLRRFYQSAQQERLRHRLGVIGRARVAFALQKHLLAVGYAPDLVKQVLFALLLSAFVADKA